MRTTSEDRRVIFDKYKELGSSFTDYLYDISIKNYPGKKNIELYLLDYHDDFMYFYKRDGVADYYDIAFIFRRVANKVYRYLLKKGEAIYNKKFLNVVKP